MTRCQEWRGGTWRRSSCLLWHGLFWVEVALAGRKVGGILIKGGEGGGGGGEGISGERRLLLL